MENFIIRESLEHYERMRKASGKTAGVGSSAPPVAAYALRKYPRSAHSRAAIGKVFAREGLADVHAFVICEDSEAM
jgi:hypothetical protein